jgi:hypothetical protein
MMSGSRPCQDIDVEIRYKIINPNKFDMSLVLGAPGDNKNGKTKLVFNGNDITDRITSDTVLSNNMIIGANKSHTAKYKTTVNTCSATYVAEMKIKLKPVDPRNGFANACKY